MKVIIHNTRVNLHTGERFGVVVGGGERKEFQEGTVPLTDAQLACLAKYQRHMQDVAIPEIVESIQERARLAAKNKSEGRVLFS